jgi:hypothetical protein
LISLALLTRQGPNIHEPPVQKQFNLIPKPDDKAGGDAKIGFKGQGTPDREGGEVLLSSHFHSEGQILFFM